ncbi:MAG: glycosyltransferase [Pyrinomonadaceae bacterium]|nr:glycosyltransferase [Pyrinomonadaceae bacterium]
MSNKRRPKILVFSDYYLPGYKSGGGMRTIVNMVERLSHKYHFYVVTRDHDGVQDREPYTTVEIDSWNDIGQARVFYLSRHNIGATTIKKLVEEVSPDVLYTNSCFSTLAIYLLKLRRLRVIEDRPVVIAPCGELSVGALELKKSKKQIFLNWAKLIRLYRNVIWKASTKLEADEVLRMNPKEPTIMVAPDLPSDKIFPEYSFESKPNKAPGRVKIVFVSRFHKKKNFNWVIPILTRLNGEVLVDIIGPIQDWDYFQETEHLISELPENIQVSAVGPVPHESVCRTMSDYHFFICPTLGENFGHIFLEAMAAGCPLLISDRTPWLNLQEKGIGWDIPLEEPEAWESALQECVDMDSEGFAELSKKSRAFVTDWLSSPELDSETESVLDHAVEVSRRNAAVA